MGNRCHGSKLSQFNGERWQFVYKIVCNTTVVVLLMKLFVSILPQIKYSKHHHHHHHQSITDGAQCGCFTTDVSECKKRAGFRRCQSGVLFWVWAAPFLEYMPLCHSGRVSPPPARYKALFPSCCRLVSWFRFFLSG